MFKSDEIAKVHARVMDVIQVLDGLTVGDAQLVLKQAEVSILGAQRVIAHMMVPTEALEAIKVNLGYA